MSVSAGMSAIRQRGKLPVKFNGFYFAKLDHKNRFVLPAAFQRLVNQDRLVLTAMQAAARIIVGCENATWRESIGRLGSPELESITAFTFESRVDQISRYLIPGPIMELVGFKPKDELAVVGCGDHLQIWKKEAWLKEIQPK